MNTKGIKFLAVLAVISAVFLLPKKWRWPALALLLVFALVIVWFWPGTGGGIWELHEILHGRSHLSFGSNRIAVWKYSLRLAPERLLTGGGSDTFVLRFNQYLHDTGYIIPERQGQTLLPHYFDNPHNEYIAQLMNHGLPAMLLLILLMREACSPVLTPYSAAVLCYAVQAFFSFPVCLVAPMFWSLLGMSFRSDENC